MEKNSGKKGYRIEKLYWNTEITEYMLLYDIFVIDGFKSTSATQTKIAKFREGYTAYSWMSDWDSFPSDS
jgi:hypothetical protein